MGAMFAHRWYKMKSRVLHKGNPSEFLSCYITVDERYVRYYTWEMKEQSKQWIPSAQLASKKTKMVSLFKKIMTTISQNLRLTKKKKGKNDCSIVLCLLLEIFHDELMKKHSVIAIVKIVEPR